MIECPKKFRLWQLLICFRALTIIMLVIQIVIYFCVLPRPPGLHRTQQV